MSVQPRDNYIVPAIIYGVISGGVGCIIEILKHVTNYAVEKCEKMLYYRIIINKSENPRCARAIEKEIENILADDDTIILKDSFPTPNVGIQNKEYRFVTNSIGVIYIEFKDSIITIKMNKLLNGKHMGDFRAYI